MRIAQKFVQIAGSIYYSTVEETKPKFKAMKNNHTEQNNLRNQL